MRDVASLAKAARRHGDAIGVYAERLLDTDLPWTKCGTSTGCSGSCAGTAQARWMPCAPARWIRRRQRHQDRPHAGEGDREHAPAAAPRGVPGEEERRREDARICSLLALDTSTELRRLFPHRKWAPSCARSMDATAISARLAIRRARFRRRLHRAGQLLHAQRPSIRRICPASAISPAARIPAGQAAGACQGHGRGPGRFRDSRH